MMIFTALFPVLAFAATGFQNVTYQYGTVSGSVYSDVYEPSITDVVYMYDPNGNLVGSATATGVTYSVYEGVYTYHYGFSGSVSGYYNYLNLQEKVTDSVYQNVYNSTPSSSGGSGSSGGGGGGGGGVSSGPTIQVTTDGFVDSGSLTASLETNDTVTLNLNGDLALIPAKALVGFTSENKVLRVSNANGTYILPLSLFNLDELAQKLGVSVDDLKIKVSISAVTGQAASDIAAAVSALGATSAAASVDFNIVAVGPDDSTAAIDFGNRYVSRVIPVNQDVNWNQATGVLYDTATGKLSFVPTVFDTTDGQTNATLKRNGSSIYTVVTLSKSFGDLAGHWSQPYVEILANKLVVDGVSDTSFEPDRNISRAEFAALVVRSLGLGQGTYSGEFNDVNSGAWYAGVVGAAVKAHIIDGYEDGTFRPDAQISREELAAMVVRAMNYAGLSTEVSSDEQSSLLGKFTDASSIVWAQKEIAAAIHSGIIEGMTESTIGAAQHATRAQSATMLKRFLSGAAFIN